MHFSALAASYPVALRFLQRVSPVEFFEVGEQTPGIGAHTQTPLVHHFLLHRVAAAQAQPLAHLVVGEHRAERRTPIHHRVAQVGYAPVHESVAFLARVHGVPFGCRELQLLGAGRMQPLGAVSVEMGRKLGHGACGIGRSVVVAFEHALERPLRPLVVRRVAGAYLAAPVVAETYLLQLRAVARYVVDSGLLRMLSRLYGILLGRQAVGVVAHRVKHVESAQAFVTRIYVAGYVAQRMTHMQACARRVGEHVEYIEFRTRRVLAHTVYLLVAPILLQARFYLLRIVVHYLCGVEMDISVRYASGERKHAFYGPARTFGH